MKKISIPLSIILFLSSVFSFMLFKTSVTGFLLNDLSSNPYNKWEEELEPGGTSGTNKWMMQEYMMTADPNTGEVPVHLAYEEYKNIRYQRGVDPSEIYWEERGPYNVGGRTRAIMWDPNDPTHRKLWAGGVTGGLWYTDNPFTTDHEWKQVGDLWDNLVISCIAYDPANTQTFYVGTGEGWFNDPHAIPGLGMWKSVDGGVSWEHLSSTYTNDDFRHVQKIIVHPSNRYVYAATRDKGVMRSTDLGVSWNPVLNTSPPNPSLSNRAADLEITADGDILASMGFYNQSDGVYISSNGDPGTWTRLNDGSNNFPTAASGIRRIELAVAPSDANVIYALVEDDSSVIRPHVKNSDLNGIYKSTDKGLSWHRCKIPALRVEEGDTIYFSAGQTNYDLIAAVRPDNPNTLFVGGVSLHLSLDGGSTWDKINDIHDDHHAILFKPNDYYTVVVGNDGGVYSFMYQQITPDINDLNKGFNVTQFHACALHPVSGVDYILAGAQDNGTQQFVNPGMNYTETVIGADGGYCYIFKHYPAYQIVSTQNNVFFLSTNSGVDFTKICHQEPTYELISPWDYDESTNTLYASWDKRNIFVMTKVTSHFALRRAFKTCYSNITGNYDLFWEGASAFKVSPFIDSTVFVGTNDGKLYKLSNAYDTLNCQIDTLTGINFPNGRINCIEFGSNENQIIVVFSNYGVPSVWESIDGGANWENREGDLPNIPIYWAIYNPLDNRQVILATELGVWTTEDINVNSPSWVPVNNGIPVVRTRMLKVRESDNLIIAATYGRGIFSTNDFFVSPSDKILASDGQLEDSFGNDVSINGDFAIVGAPDEDEKGDNAGAIYIYEQLNNRWTESAKVLAPDGAAGDHFGDHVEMSNDLAIVAGGGSAYIYRLSGNSWNFEEKINPNDGHIGDNFGADLAIFNDLIAVGASGSSGTGAVYIFTYQAGNWIQTEKILPSDGVSGDQFGYSIDLYGNYLIAGSPWNAIKGAAYVYHFDNGWTLDKKITADDGKNSDLFGLSVAIYHQYAVAGAPNADGKLGILSPGAAYVYFNSTSSNWEQRAKLWAPDAWTFQMFGQSVSVFEDYIIIGAPRDYEFGFSSGAAYVYKDESGNSTNWIRQNKLFAEDGDEDDWFGYSVDIYGATAIVSSIFDDDNGSSSGSAYIFKSIINASNLPILSVMPPSFSVTSSQSTINIEINNNNMFFSMDWEAYSLESWLQFVGDSTGTNNGTLTVNVDENLYCSRTGKIIVRAPVALSSPREVTIYQEANPGNNELKITSNDLNDHDLFGISVDLDGDFAIVGAAGNSEFGANAGAAYIFERDGCCSWIQKAKLHINEPLPGDHFGYSVAISGDVAVVGTIGYTYARDVYVFEKPPGGWEDTTETAILMPSEGIVSWSFGESVDISGEYVIIGAYETNSIFIFEKPSGGWQDMNETYYYRANNGYGLGKAVAIDGNFAVAGKPHDVSTSGGGAAYIFKLDWNWGFEDKIIPSDGQSQDVFGSSVDIKGNRIIVGSQGNLAAYIFYKKTDNWIEEQKITAPPGGSYFAHGVDCVSIDGQYAIVGAYLNIDSLYRSGSAFSFIRNDTEWLFSKQIFNSDLHEDDNFGVSVSIGGPYTIIGAWHKENSSGLDAGAAYIYCTEGDIVTSVETQPEQALPVSYDLKQNYPNPFNPVTTIVFDLPKTTKVTLKIYTILGEEVTTLVSEELKAGTHKYTWNPVSLASGVYLYRIESKEYTVTKKMVFLK